MFQFKSLHDRIALFMLLPVAVLLVVAGALGFGYARKNLLEQWRQAAILELQQEAHQIDMLLGRPKLWMALFYDSASIGPGGHHIREWVLDQLRSQEGVVRVKVNWTAGVGMEPPVAAPMMDAGAATAHAGMHAGQGRSGPGSTGPHIREITPPRYDASIDRQTVSLVSDLIDSQGRISGRMEVVLRFDSLFGNMEASGLWQGHQAYLVDAAGNILYSRTESDRRRLYGTSDPLELKTLYGMMSLPYGTLMGPGYPPKRVAGFYRLMEAPWTLVVIAPGDQILQPILHFGLYYLLFGAIFVVVVLVVIRLVTGQTVNAVQEISAAAQQIAEGDYQRRLPVKTADEVGELTRSFNAMVVQLEERLRMKEALNLAMEVQQNLLPQQSLQFGHLDISGRSLYCDETGGDYYDFIRFPDSENGRIGIAVGDVVGHGVPAALLMTTVRALLRSRVAQPGNPARILTDVNQRLCEDTADTGNFMTLFFLSLDTDRHRLEWVRAGHDPAVRYDPQTDRFEELKGSGMALGVDAGFAYCQCAAAYRPGGQVVLIGTDGIWETRNADGESFGKQRIFEVIRRYHRRSATEIRDAVTDALAVFRGNRKQVDDVTLVVVKT